MTPEKQEGVYQEGSIIVVRDGPCGLERKLVAFEALIANTAYAQGATSRDAEVEALKAEVARFSRDANYWKWCNGCGSAKEDCEKWKDAGKVACCPECHHWPWNR